MTRLAPEEPAAAEGAGEEAVAGGDRDADGDGAGAPSTGPSSKAEQSTAMSGVLAEILPRQWGGKTTGRRRRRGGWSLCGEEDGRFRDGSASDVDEGVEVASAAGDAVGVEEVDTLSERREPVGDFCAVILARRLW